MFMLMAVLEGAKLRNIRYLPTMTEYEEDVSES
jgi:hypothetical protein